MEVNWKNNETHESAILIKRAANFEGFSVAHSRVLPGELPAHTAKHNEVNLSIDGKLFTQRHTSGGTNRRDTANSGSMCMMPVGQTLDAFWEAEYEYVAIDFSQKYLSEMALEMNLSPNIELKETVTKKDELLQYLSLAFLEETEKNPLSSNLYTDSIAHTLMFHLIKNYTTAVVQAKQFLGGLSGYKLRRVTEFINDNLEQDLTLTEIAAVADLSRFHFARSFSKTLGVTPQQYIAARRIEKAKDLLSHSNLPIVEIGFQTGFKNQSHFTTLFRKIAGFTPKVWREVSQM
jgi:AraC family transcriptional regulator